MTSGPRALPSRLLLTLALVALVVRVLVPPGYMPGSDGSILELCTPEGMRLIRLGPDGPVEVPDQEQAAEHCVFSLVSGPALADPPDPPILPVQAVVEQLRAVAFAARIEQRRHRPQAQRAPPVLPV